MTVVLDAQCGRCEAVFTTPAGGVPIQCPTCDAVLLQVEGQLSWLLPAEVEQLGSRQEQVSPGGRENGRIVH